MRQNSTLPGKKTIYIIRHGETEYNRKGIVQGSGIDSDLNEQGRRQAQKFYQNYHHVPFDKIYTSSLKRTVQSVEPFLKKEIPHQEIPELNEINWGKFEGVKGDPSWQKEYYKMIDAWQSGHLHYRIENGESPLELQHRQKNGLKKILENCDENTILICMHGRALKSFLCLLLNKPLNRMDDFKHTNLCLYMLEYDGNEFELKLENCNKHL